MQPIVCGRCGLENPAGELVCARCGTELDDAAAKQLVGETVLGVYVIDDILGKGGMSVVYRAYHRMTEQRVALKVLPPELAVHASLKVRFLDEAKALARLEHPNIVRLYNFGEEGGRFVLAMEYVEGKTFERLIFERGKVDWATCTRVCIEVLRALEYAHEKGVVHRDIKPSNVLVRQDGSATVMDFGIAKMTESSRLTATGQTMGTVRYMSPEQVRGQNVDHRTDLYSLGIALYEGLTGDTPFQGETHFDIMSKHLNEPPRSVREIVPEVPEALDRVVLHSLGKGRDDRWQTAGAFREALEKCLAGHGASAVAPAPLTPSSAAVTAPGGRPSPSPAAGIGTSVSDRLEPAPVDVDAMGAPRKRTGLWLGLAGVVVAAAAGVAVIMMARGDEGQKTPGAGPPGGGTQNAKPADASGGPREPAWPEPPRLDDLTLATDQRFDAPESVRVLSTRKLDAGHVARAYVVARKRFMDFVATRAGDGAAVEVHPLNLFIAPPALLCDARVHAPEKPPSNCAKLAFFYEPGSRTLFVPDDDMLEVLGIPEGAAVHLCRTTPALHQKGCGKALLEPFFDELEGSLP